VSHDPSTWWPPRPAPFAAAASATGSAGRAGLPGARSRRPAWRIWCTRQRDLRHRLDVPHRREAHLSRVTRDSSATPLTFGPTCATPPGRDTALRAFDAGVGGPAPRGGLLRGAWRFDVGGARWSRADSATRTRYGILDLPTRLVQNSKHEAGASCRGRVRGPAVPVAALFAMQKGLAHSYLRRQQCSAFPPAGRAGGSGIASMYPPTRSPPAASRAWSAA